MGVQVLLGAVRSGVRKIGEGPEGGREVGVLKSGMSGLGCGAGGDLRASGNSRLMLSSSRTASQANTGSTLYRWSTTTPVQLSMESMKPSLAMFMTALWGDVTQIL
jgi:hypothetical protein